MAQVDPLLGQSNNIEDLNPIESMGDAGTRQTPQKPVVSVVPVASVVPGSEQMSPPELVEEKDMETEALGQPMGENAGQVNRLDRRMKDGRGKKGGKTRAELEEQNKLNGIRNGFHKSLAKLSETDTREVGMQELQRIIKDNATPTALRVYLGLLAEGYKQVSTNGKELQVLLLGYIAKVYKQALLDPLDKPPNLIKSVARVLEILHKYLHVSTH